MPRHLLAEGAERNNNMAGLMADRKTPPDTETEAPVRELNIRGPLSLLTGIPVENCNGGNKQQGPHNIKATRTEC